MFASTLRAPRSVCKHRIRSCHSLMRCKPLERYFRFECPDEFNNGLKLYECVFGTSRRATRERDETVNRRTTMYVTAQTMQRVLVACDLCRARIHSREHTKQIFNEFSKVSMCHGVAIGRQPLHLRIASRRCEKVSAPTEKWCEVNWIHQPLEDKIRDVKEENCKKNVFHSRVELMCPTKYWTLFGLQRDRCERATQMLTLSDEWWYFFLPLFLPRQSSPARFDFLLQRSRQN